MKNRKNALFLIILFVGIFFIPANVSASNVCTYVYDGYSLGGWFPFELKCTIESSSSVTCVETYSDKVDNAKSKTFNRKVLNLSKPYKNSTFSFNNFYNTNKRCPRYVIFNISGKNVSKYNNMLFEDSEEGANVLVSDASTDWSGNISKVLLYGSDVQQEDQKNDCINSISLYDTTYDKEFESRKQKLINMECPTFLLNDDETSGNLNAHATLVSECSSTNKAFQTFLRNASVDLDGLVTKGCFTKESTEYSNYDKQIQSYMQFSVELENKLKKQANGFGNPGKPHKPVNDLNTSNFGDCTSLLGENSADGSDNGTVTWLLNKFFLYFKIAAPLIVLLLSGVDFIKVIIVNDEDNMKKAQKKLITRIIIAILLFLVPTLVSLLLSIFGINDGGFCIVSK